MPSFKYLAFSVLICTTLFGCQSSSNLALTSVQNTASVNQIVFGTEAMMADLNKLQKIAEQNGGNRAVGTQGGLLTAQYILDQAKKAGLTAQMLPFENREKTVGQNIIVEIKGQSKDSAVILGAHYDSVKTGPGINDNATGVAVLLDLMREYQLKKIVPQHTIYFAFWDSEEVGIAGSQAFVKNLTADQLNGIKAYINLDMVGTKDPNIMIADGDKSSIAEMEKMLAETGMPEEDYKPLTEGLRQLPSHENDVKLENVLKQFFKYKGHEIREDVSTLTASDTLSFLGKVPVTSIILFNETMKGNVLEFAPCYHQACDTLEHIDPASLRLTKEATLYLIDRINNNDMR